MKLAPRAALAATLLLTLATRPTAHAGELLGKMLRGLATPAKAAHRAPPTTTSDCAVEKLADQIDWLEHHIDRFGSIVAKHPDIWGQSRLTRHRAEYERLLAAEATPGRFQEVNNASLRRSDQSFLGLALAVQEAVAPQGTTTGKPNTDGPFQNVTTLIATGTDAQKNAIPLERTPPFTVAADGGKDFATFGLGTNAIGLEPTIHLDHLDRYVKHLQELRRINEGDDIADSPGYALNLVRIPVSILPGKHTQRGHGAEISVIAEPQLGADLLPTTFRNLVINDLVDLLAPSLTYSVNDRDVVRVAQDHPTPTPAAEPARPTTTDRGTPRQGLTKNVLEVETQTASRARQAVRTLPLTLYPSVQTRRARLPVPREHLVDLIGFHQFLRLVTAANDALRPFPTNAPCIHYTDVRGWLAEELHAAYDLLTQPPHLHAWEESCGPALAQMVRGRRTADLAAARCRFFAALGLPFDPDTAACPHGCFPEDPPEQPLCRTTTAVLAWAILVESALLNERLAEDMRESATAKGYAGDGAAWAGPFYGPHPSPEARHAFNDYVRRRWPIRVFALDPVAQEQNVEDMYAMRRETQIAMALAAAGGRVNSQAMMRYARRLETDLATVGLNKTAVGFSHGNDTFGWRFYPRVQTPPTRNTIANFAETLAGSNSTTRDLAERRIEPGMRECTAIVVMPSFVPYVTFDVRTNWFSLTHPAATDQSMRQTLHLSRSVKAMQQSAAVCSRCAGAYRDGEVARLLRRVDQLDRELPLQTMLAQIPHENTSGGFELFNTGVTDLAPELIGWYGTQGVDPRTETTVFLVGKGFSIHDTSLVAGGKPVAKANMELISRQVLKVTLPAGLEPRRLPRPARCGDPISARTRPPARLATHRRPPAAAVVLVGNDSAIEELPNGTPTPTPDPSALFCPAAADACDVDCHALEVVDVHVATPYGVSNRLLIPVLDGTPRAGAMLAFDPPLTITLFAGMNSEKTWRLDEYYEATEPEILIRAPDVFIPPANAKLRFLLREANQPEQGRMAFATISIPAPPFDSKRSVYRLAGADLRNFIGDTSRPASDKTLRGGLNPYVEHTKGQETTFIAEATLVTDAYEDPIAGTLTVEIVRNEAARAAATAD